MIIVSRAVVASERNCQSKNRPKSSIADHARPRFVRHRSILRTPRSAFRDSYRLFAVLPPYPAGAFDPEVSYQHLTDDADRHHQEEP